MIISETSLVHTKNMLENQTHATIFGSLLKITNDDAIHGKYSIIQNIVYTIRWLTNFVWEMKRKLWEDDEKEAMKQKKRRGNQITKHLNHFI